ncbi:hypothetical protein IWW39_006457, partial [Coemansia spiralis]
TAEIDDAQHAQPADAQLYAPSADAEVDAPAAGTAPAVHAAPADVAETAEVTAPVEAVEVVVPVEAAGTAEAVEPAVVADRAGVVESFSSPPIYQVISAAQATAQATATAARVLVRRITYAQVTLGSRLHDTMASNVVEAAGDLLIAIGKEFYSARRAASSIKCDANADSFMAEAATKELISLRNREAWMCDSLSDYASLDSYMLAIKKVEEGADRRAAIWRAISDDTTERTAERIVARTRRVEQISRTLQKIRFSA